MGRKPCCDKTKVKRGPWSSEEDSILKNYLHSNGTVSNWITLPHKAGLKRCGKSCRLRWLNYLRPDIKHGGFTDEEDNIILDLYLNIGSRWSVIASKLQGRTDNDVKNYWNTKMKKLVRAQRANINVSRINNNSTDLPKVEVEDYDNKDSVMNNSKNTTTFPNLLEMSSRSIVSWLMDEEINEDGISFSMVSSSQENTPVLSPSFSQKNSNYASWYGTDMRAYDQAELEFLDGFDFQKEIGEFGIEANSKYSSIC